VPEGTGVGIETSRPRIAHIATVDSTIRFMLLDQLQMFERAGFDVTAISAPGPWVADIAAAGVRFKPWHNITRSWSITRDARALAELIGILRHERFDLVHTHNPKPGLIGRVAARIAEVPFVVNTVHGLYSPPDDGFSIRRALLLAEWGAARLSDFELYQSGEDLERARRLRIARRGHSARLGNGIDVPRFNPNRVDKAAVAALRERLEIPEEAVVVGMVGRLVAEKGWREFFAAAHRVRAAHPNVVFVAIGPDDEEKSDRISPEEIRRASVDVRFCGMTLDMPSALAMLDIFVLASYREGFPRAAIEAAVMGKPLILTDIRGCREVVEHGNTGLLVRVRSAEALVSAIERLLTDRVLAARLGRAALAHAQREFNERKVVQRTLAVYDSLLHGRPRLEAVVSF